jgi:hypothetical protein
MQTPVSSAARETVQQLGRQTGNAAREASPAIEALGRFGFAAKGVVYVLIGLLALQAALGTGGQITDQQGALAAIAQAPFGRAILMLITIGLLGYALWRFVQAWLDTENKGSEPKGLATRAMYAGVGLIYVGLALAAVRILLGTGGGDSGQQTQDWTARVLSQPLGAWAVGLAGAAVVVNGLLQFVRAYTAKFKEKLRLQEMEPTQVETVTQLGRAGYAARGVAFGIIGFFLISAARHANPEEVRGLSGALEALAQQPFGPWLLGAVAAGLVAYGLFALVEARFRRMVIR